MAVCRGRSNPRPDVRNSNQSNPLWGNMIVEKRGGLLPSSPQNSKKHQELKALKALKASRERDARWWCPWKQARAVTRVYMPRRRMQGGQLVVNLLKRDIAKRQKTKKYDTRICLPLVRVSSSPFFLRLEQHACPLTNPFRRCSFDDGKEQKKPTNSPLFPRRGPWPGRRRGCPETAPPQRRRGSLSPAHKPPSPW